MDGRPARRDIASWAILVAGQHAELGQAIRQEMRLAQLVEQIGQAHGATPGSWLRTPAGAWIAATETILDMLSTS